MNILFLRSDQIACGVVRADVPARAISQLPGHFAYCKDALDLSDLFGLDAAVIQRPHNEDHIMVIQKLQARGVTVFADVDDDLYAVAGSCGEKVQEYFDSPKTQANMTTALRLVDGLTTSTPHMAQTLYHRTGVRSVVLRNCCDLEHAQLTRLPPPDRPTVIWCASRSHIADVCLIQQALRELIPKYGAKLLLYGHFEETDLPTTLAGIDVEFNGWTHPFGLYSALSRATIALAPLREYPFNLTRSEGKWMEAAAVGVPTLVSPLQPYSTVRDGVDALVVSGNTADDWYKCIELALSEPGEMAKIGQAALARVQSDYSHIKRAEEWVKVLTDVGNVRV